MGMTILDQITELSSGARFFRADLHIHSHGASVDVLDEKMTPEAIVTTACNESLDIIALTDHDSISNVAAFVDAADGTSVTAIPGVELSTPEGHLLVYMNGVDELTRYYNRLDIVDPGTQNSRCQNGMLDCLNRLDESGIAVLAHFESGNGLGRKVSGWPPSKLDILCHKSLMGFEVTRADSQVHFDHSDTDPQRKQIEQMRRERLGEGGQFVLARLMSSDSHSLTTLGHNASGNKRLTRVKMESPGFANLRTALQFPDARLRLEDDIPEARPVIRGVQMSGGFLDAQGIHFSPNLTCIIGGRGAGKSTAFESVRCLASQPSMNPVVDSEAWSDSINLLWEDQTGTAHNLVRYRGRAIQNEDDPETGPAAFSVECYGQGETAQLSKDAKTDPSALMSYLDQFIDVGTPKQSIQRLRDELLTNQTAIEKAILKVKQIPETERQLKHTRDQLKTLEKKNVKELIELERYVADEGLIREELENSLSTLKGSVSYEAAVATIETITSRADPAKMKVGAEPYRTISTTLTTVAKSLEASATTEAKKLEDAQPKIKLAIGAWEANEKAAIGKIELKRAELAKAGVKLDLSYIRKLAEDEAGYTKELDSLAKWKTHNDKLLISRAELLTDLAKERTVVFKSRHGFGMRATNHLANALSDLAVKVQFIQGADSQEAEDIISRAMGWRTNQVPRARAIVRQLTVAGLLKAASDKNVKAITKLTNEKDAAIFDKGAASELLERISKYDIRWRLERADVDDLARITVTKKIDDGDGNTKHVSRHFSKLSLGQQQSVLLALMLSSDSNDPLLIDQPEDNLDGEFIYSSLIPVLRRAKERRQVIVVTHNPNIAVLGDAELIVAIKSMSDRGMVVQRGSIDDPETCKVVCQVLEGAQDAFTRRARVYGVL